MQLFENILIVIQHADELQSLLPKTLRLATDKSAQKARIHIVKIVYEGLADISTKEIDKSNELKQFILQSEEEELAQHIADFRCESVEITSAILWNRRLCEGILHAAESCSADLIVKSATEDERGFIRTPDDWNLLRETTTPVIFTHPEPWQRNPTILVAVDALDAAHDELSVRLLERSAALCQKLKGDLHICTFYPLFEPWSTKLGLLQSYKELRTEIQRDIALAVSRLVRSIGAPHYELHTVEGNPEFGMEALAKDLNADLVVIGNRARDGIEAMMIGNTAEKILHDIKRDILTID